MFVFSGIAAYQQSLQEGKVTCEQAVLFYLNRIQSNESLNAFVEVFAEEALLTARKLDDQRKNKKQAVGRLHGVVVALKDVISYESHGVSASSNMLKGYKATYHATVVDRLLKEEAIIIGNCNCDEFAMGSTNENSAYGPVLNALDQTKVPGGSSGGSAVAVQAELCMVSLGSDTGGSVRQPADFCGIVGYKPAYGTLSRYGLIAYASSFDQVGVFANNIEDIALMMEVMAGPDDHDSTATRPSPIPAKIDLQQEKKYRVTYFNEMLEHPTLDKEIAASIKKQIEQLRAAGHEVEASTFNLIDYIVPAYYVLTTAEASSNLSRYDGIRYGHRNTTAAKDLTSFYLRNRSEGFGMEVKRRIMLGTFVLSTGFYDAYYNKALQVRRLLTEHIALVFKNFDFVLMPNSPSTAFSLGAKDKDPIAMYLADIFTVYANLTALPAIALPLFKHSNGMPFGLQVLANRKDEVNLLSFSHELMKSRSASVAD